MKGFSLFLNFIAATIIGLTIMGVLVVVFCFLPDKKEPVQRYHIEYSPKSTIDSLYIDPSSIVILDSILAELRVTSNIIQKRQEHLLENAEDENLFNKLVTALVAIIFAIAGFFGFKSINEIKATAIDEAREEAENTVKIEVNKIAKRITEEEFKRIFDSEYKAEVNRAALAAYTEKLRSDIEPLIDRISRLEEKDTNVNYPSDKEDDFDGLTEPENPFDKDEQ